MNHHQPPKINSEKNTTGKGKSPSASTASISTASMRLAFGAGLVKAGEANRNVVVLTADLGQSTGVECFKNRFPERYVDVGIAEQNLVTVASGMARMGKIPFVASYAIFSPGRNWEQIRTTVCYNNLPVKIVGTHAGLNVGPDGGSHQALEDVALMRVLPRMVVVSPCDAIEAEKVAVAIAKTTDPTYVRLPREKSPVMTSANDPFKIGKASIIYRSKVDIGRGHGSMIKRVGIIATGPIIEKALIAARKLEADGKFVEVINMSTIKPLDVDSVIHLAHEMGAIVTVEEHQIAGGLGSAVSECLSSTVPAPIEFVGVKDVYGQSGKPDELSEFYGLGAKDIVAAAERTIIRAK